MELNNDECGFVFLFFFFVKVSVRLYPDGEVDIEAPRGAAVLGGIDERQRAECVLQQTASKCVGLLTAKMHTHEQDAPQLPLVF